MHVSLDVDAIVSTLLSFVEKKRMSSAVAIDKIKAIKIALEEYKLQHTTWSWWFGSNSKIITDQINPALAKVNNALKELKADSISSGYIAGGSVFGLTFLAAAAAAYALICALEGTFFNYDAPAGKINISDIPTEPNRPLSADNEVIRRDETPHQVDSDGDSDNGSVEKVLHAAAFGADSQHLQKNPKGLRIDTDLANRDFNVSSAHVVRDCLLLPPSPKSSTSSIEGDMYSDCFPPIPASEPVQVAVRTRFDEPSRVAEAAAHVARNYPLPPSPKALTVAAAFKVLGFQENPSVSLVKARIAEMEGNQKSLNYYGSDWSKISEAIAVINEKYINVSDSALGV